MNSALYELAAFGIQLGLAIAGAAALWGLVLLLWRRDGVSERVALYLLWLFYGGLITSAGAWLVAAFIPAALAHEGIVLVPTSAEREAAFELMQPWFALWVALSVAFFFVRRRFQSHLAWFYALQLASVSLLISVQAWTGDLATTRQLFFIGHSFHSILTLGTVVAFDYLYLCAEAVGDVRRRVYELLPLVSKVVLAGLAIEFASVALIFQDAVALTPKFFFMQTVIGILLINGMIVAGPVARRLRQAVQDGSRLSPRWQAVADVSGTISITSWFTITFVDFFHGLTLDYAQFAAGYVAFIILAYCLHALFMQTIFQRLKTF